MAEQNNSDTGFSGRLWQSARDWVRGLAGAKPAESSQPLSANEITDPCCGPSVHIAYRGKSDDRMYVAYNRRWQEVQFFQKNGLRVFCADCRRRLL